MPQMPGSSTMFSPRRALLAMTVLAMMAAGCRTAPVPATAAAGTAATPAVASTMAATADTARARREEAARARQRLYEDALQQIAGRDTLPASQVFENVKVFPNMRAGQFLRMMNNGFGTSLGVGCEHCHVTAEWASDSKPQKQVTRDMIAMVRAINTEQLRKIPNLRSQNPGVSCATCHRGDPIPAREVR